MNTLLLVLVVALLGLLLVKQNKPKVIYMKPLYNQQTYHQPARPINLNTQHVAPFRKIGLLYSGKRKGILPLIGRQIHRGSYRWNYYTLSNNNMIKIPLSHKGRECDDKYGCEELYDDDVVFIPEYNENFTVKLY